MINNNLAARLKQAAHFLLLRFDKEQNLNEMQEELESLGIKLNEARAEKRKLSSYNTLIPILSFFFTVLLGIALIAFVIAGSSIGTLEYMQTLDDLNKFLTIGAISGALAVILLFSYLILSVKVKRSHSKEELTDLEKKYIEEIDFLNERITSTRDTIAAEKANAEPHISFLPAKYRNAHATTFMFDCVKNGKAYTLSEAINAYEAQRTNFDET